MQRPTWMREIDGVPVAQGLLLRSILVLAMLDSGQPMTVAALEQAVTRAGYCVPGRPGKAVSDALRAELARERVVRVRRATYAAGYVAKVTQHRMRNRVAGMWN